LHTNIFSQEVVPVQIDGVRNFLSQFAVRPNRAGQIGYANLPNARNVDTLTISEAGKRLRFHSEDTVKLSKQSTETISDPLLQAMDKSIKEVNSILEKMKALTAAAQSEKLTKLDRMEMQIEMEDLRKNLREAMTASHLELAEMLGIEKGPLYSGSMELKSPALPGEDERSVLQRARDRLVKGEEWDVAEAYEVIESEDGERAGGQWVVLNDTDEPAVRKKREIDLTVRQKLEKSNTIILMDAKSATEGVERLEEEIGKVNQMYERFTRFAQKYQPESSDKAGTDVTDILKTPKGGMFQSIERLFRGLLGSLAEGVVSEAGAPETGPVTGKIDDSIPCAIPSTNLLGATETEVVPEAGSEGIQTWAGVNSAMMTEIMARIGFDDESLRMYHVSNESIWPNESVSRRLYPVKITKEEPLYETPPKGDSVDSTINLQRHYAYETVA
jgi:hypothetical protein